MFLLFTLSGYAAGYKGLTTGGWQIRFDDQKGGVSLYKKSKNICEGLYASYLWGEQTVTTRDYARHRLVFEKYQMLSVKELFIRLNIQINLCLS